jgi:excisionase family DNA binding protein
LGVTHATISSSLNRDSQLALAFVEALDDRALDVLADALAPRLGTSTTQAPAPVVYTVATLAAELGVSGRAIRAAIHRGELEARKRGRTYVITRAAVEAWAAPDAGRAQRRDRPSRERRHGRVMASALARLDGER